MRFGVVVRHKGKLFGCVHGGHRFFNFQKLFSNMKYLTMIYHIPPTSRDLFILTLKNSLFFYFSGRRYIDLVWIIKRKWAYSRFHCNSEKQVKTEGVLIKVSSSRQTKETEILTKNSLWLMKLTMESKTSEKEFKRTKKKKKKQGVQITKNLKKDMRDWNLWFNFSSTFLTLIFVTFDAYIVRESFYRTILSQ